MRKLKHKNIRKIFRSGNSYVVSLPIEIVGKLGWKESQKVTVKRVRGGMLIKDWRK